MPTPISHATVGYALGVWIQPGTPLRRVSVVAAACAAVPDIDVIAWPLIAHRGITHSLLFAMIAALLATVVLFPRGAWPQRRPLLIVLGLAVLSHSCLDALSTYSSGIQFFAPFSDQRYRFAWTPLGDPGGRLPRQLLQEALLVFVPALLLGWAGLKVRRGR